MMRAYDELYLEDARRNLARMLDFIVYELKMELNDFFKMFVKSKKAEEFEHGSSTVLAGKSGVELAYEVIEEQTGNQIRIEVNYPVERSREYWLGWVLAYYQWYTAMSFKEIIDYVTLDEILELYSPYHEMDIRQFVEKMNQLYLEAKKDTNLKILRKKAGLSLKVLSEITGVPLRTLQQYEQRQKNINKAQVDYLIKLSKGLCCEVEAIIEKV